MKKRHVCVFIGFAAFLALMLALQLIADFAIGPVGAWARLLLGFMEGMTAASIAVVFGFAAASHYRDFKDLEDGAIFKLLAKKHLVTDEDNYFQKLSDTAAVPIHPRDGGGWERTRAPVPFPRHKEVRVLDPIWQILQEATQST